MVSGSIFETALLLALFLTLCFLLIVARRAYEIVTGCKKVGLPRPRRNNLLMYLRWIFSLFRNSTHRNNAVLYAFSRLSLVYKKSGLVHIGIPFVDLVLLFKASTVQPLLQSSSNIDRPIFYHFFGEWLGSSLFLSKGDKWCRKRKLLSPAFHLKIMENFIPVMEEQSQLLVEELNRLGQNGPVDVVPLITYYILKILCVTAMGLRTKGEEYDYDTIGEHIRTVLNVIEKRLYAIWEWPDVIFRLTPNCRKLRRSVEALKKITDQIIQERISQRRTEGSEEFPNQTREPLAFLDVLLHSVHNSSDMTLENVGEEVRFFLFAGHDTSAVTLIWALYLLGKHPDVQTRLQEEVDNVIGDDQDKSLSKNVLHDLKYTEWVIKETMRLYPAVPIIGRKTNEDILIGNNKIPRGFNCVVSIRDIHLDPDIYPCPDKFYPERFSPENCSGRHPYAFIPFSAGPRNCIGQKFAMLEMKIILAKVMQKFTIRSANQNLSTRFMVTTHPDRPVQLEIKKRR